MTREGTLFAWETTAPACAGASWPKYKHDIWNTGEYETKAGRPATIQDLTASMSGSSATLHFTVPHGYLFCGNPTSYEVRYSTTGPIDDGNWAAATLATPTGVVPGTPGQQQTLTVPNVPSGPLWFVVQAVNDATRGSGNLAAISNPASPLSTTAGLLRVTSSPALPTQILVDGQIADTWGLNWMKIAPGSHTVCFTHVEGWTEPPCQSVTVSSGATTTVTGSFVQRGFVHVMSSPAVASQIIFDGKPTDDWGMFTDVPVGTHQVCFGAVADYNPPGCQTITVTAGVLTNVTGTFTSNPGAPGQAGMGLMRIASSPAVPTQITITPSGGSPYLADSWGLNWLELPPGSYTVSLSHVQGWTEPGPQTVTITAGNTTVVPANFTQRGYLHVFTSPAVAGTVVVDGIPRNDWGMWTDIPTGSHTVCFGAATGYASTPACQTLSLNAGVETDVTGTYR
jgi:hypothetical protein